MINAPSVKPRVFQGLKTHVLIELLPNFMIRKASFLNEASCKKVDESSEIVSWKKWLLQKSN